MAALSSKTAEEISDLLDQYGIKHGPIVDSTRSLYEKKLKEAMAKDAPAKKPSSDKTYYREEQTEVTYVHRRVPLRSEPFADSGRSYTGTTDYREAEDDSWDQGRSYTSTTKYREPEDDNWDHGRSYTSTTTTKYREPEHDTWDHGRSYTSASTTKYREPADDSWDQGRSYTSTAKYRELGDDSGDRPALYQSEASRRYVAQAKLPPLRTSKAPPEKEGSSGSGRLIPLWFQFLVFLVVAAFLYFVFTSMEANDGNPFKGVE